MNVPAAAEVCFLQSRHWRTQRGRLSRTAFLLPQNEAVRPSAPEKILRASFVVREHPLEPVGGHRIRKFGLIRHAPLMA